MFPKICLFWSPHMNGIIQCDLLCLASFTQHKLFKVQPFFLYIYRHTIYLFYFWLCWVWFFSSCGEWRLFSSWSAWGYSLCRGFSCCGAQAQYLWRTGLVAPQHVGSSWTRDRTCLSCTGRQILYHWATREAPAMLQHESVLHSLWLKNSTLYGYPTFCFLMAEK